MIQIDMKMPEYCDDCPMLDEYGDYPMCRITQETRGYTFNTRKRMDKCPLKNVPWLVHGRWEPSEKYFGYNKCSVCADCYIDPEWALNGKWHYCPNCGAKMDLEG